MLLKARGKVQLGEVGNANSSPTVYPTEARSSMMVELEVPVNWFEGDWPLDGGGWHRLFNRARNRLALAIR